MGSEVVESMEKCFRPTARNCFMLSTIYIFVLNLLDYNFITVK
jgi:hypothetical protein